jgi:hypothetical protein
MKATCGNRGWRPEGISFTNWTFCASFWSCHRHRNALTNILVWTSMSVVFTIPYENAVKVVLIKTRIWSRHSSRTDRTHRSAKAFALGARYVVWRIWIPSEENTVSKEDVNFLSWSCMRNANISRSLSFRSQTNWRACCVTQVMSGFVVQPAR